MKYTIRVCQGKKTRNFTLYSVLPLEAVFQSFKMIGNRTLATAEKGMPTEIKVSVILRREGGVWHSKIGTKNDGGC